MAHKKTTKLEVKLYLKPGERGYINELLERFDQLAVHGSLRDQETGLVFAERNSDADKKLVDYDGTFPMGPHIIGERTFESYKVNPSFFEA